MILSRSLRALVLWNALQALASPILAQREQHSFGSSGTGCTSDVDNECNSEPARRILHVIAPCYKEYAAVSGLIFAMLAQTDPRWKLTLVSDGLDLPMRTLVEALLAAHATAKENTATESVDAIMANGTARRAAPIIDQRVRLIHTSGRHNDGGHSPRAAGLASLPAGDPGSWTVLSGGDNYYAPLFVESVLGAIEENHNQFAVPSANGASDSPVGLVYWDFILDRKGNDIRIKRLRERAAAANSLPSLSSTRTEIGEIHEVGTFEGGSSSQGAIRWSIPIAVGDDGDTVPLSFGLEDDLFERALAFTQRHNLREGGGCELGGPDPEGLVASGRCVAKLLASAMMAEQATRPEGHYSSHPPSGEALENPLPPSLSSRQQPSSSLGSNGGLLDRYESFVSSELAQGRIDVGAFAFPTDLGQHVGYKWRHHSADWAFLDELLREVHHRNQTTRHVRRTLYVHN